VREKACRALVVAMPDHEETFSRSYWFARGSRVNGVSFRDAFLDNLLRSCPEVAHRMLRGDLESFRSTLMISIDHLASVYLNGEPSNVLKGVARRQSRGERDIEPRLYEYFLEALLQTVRQYDPKCSEDVEEAWKTVLRPGLEYMKRMY
jgi:hypothetical protein